MAIDGVEALARLLLRKEDDPPFRDFLREVIEAPAIETRAHVRSYAFATTGLRILLRREEDLLPPEMAKDPSAFRVDAIFVDGEGWRGALPGGVRLSDGEATVRARLGTPSESGGGRRGWRPWDAYDHDRCRLLITYAEARDRIDAVAIALPGRR